MPYHVTEASSAQCPAGKPWATVKTADGKVMGCHATQGEAKKQMAALYASEHAKPEGDAQYAIATSEGRYLRVGHQFRELRLAEPIMVDAKARRAAFPFSSETVAKQFFGDEILSHDPGAVDLSRISSGAAPFLWNHDRDKPIGMVERGYIGQDRRGYAEVYWFDTAFAEEARSMWNQGLRNVSTRYDINDVEELPGGTGYRVTKWAPLEISMVTIPADATVGGGRSAPGTEHEVPIAATAVRDAATSTQAATAATKGTAMTEQATAAAGATAATQGVQTANVGGDGMLTERLRTKALQAIKRQWPKEVSDDVFQKWLDNGTSVEDCTAETLQLIAEAQKRNTTMQAARIGLTAEESKRFSISRAIRANFDKSWHKIAPFEAECSQTIANRIGRSTGEHSFFVPVEVQEALGMARGQRDMVVATNTLGGYLVATQVQGFIDLLRNRSVVMRMGATVMPGLTGSVSVPKLTGASTAYWFATEAGTATESTPTVGQMTLIPKTVGGYVEVSRQLLLQTAYNADAIINGDLAQVVGLAVDLAAIAGPGTAGQPTGIVNTSGVGTANPATGTNIGYADMIKFQTTVANANAFFPGFGYVTTPTVAGLLMGKPVFTNSPNPIWGGMILDGTVAGANAMSSLQVGSGSMLAGDFSKVVIGEWGVLEIESNPYAQFQAGIIGIRALYTVDVGVRYGAAFALGTGLTG